MINTSKHKETVEISGNAAFVSDPQVGKAVESEHMPMGATNICSNGMVDLFCMDNLFSQWLTCYQEVLCCGLV
jgi:hypothetical protein